MDNLLLTPGPTKVPAECYEALARPIIHHRTPQFQQYLKEVHEGLQYVFQTKNDVYILTSSGTGAMEAAVCNLLSVGDEAIVVDSGKFGERWVELCNAYKIKSTIIKVQWGKAVTAKEIQEVLDRNKNIKAVFVTHSETSTGITTDCKALAEVVSKTPAVLVVDAVSGLAVNDLQMDNWNVDVVCSACHKGLMLPPGLGFISLNAKAFKLVEASTTPRYYFDLRRSRKSWVDTDTPFTPAINIVVGLTESLKKIKKMGLQNLLKKCEILAKGTRAAAPALGLSVFTDPACVSNVLTAINLPASIDGSKLIKTMRDKYGITSADGQDKLKGKIIRISHMGCVDENDILKGLDVFETVLAEMGYQFNKGAGVAAAKAIYEKELATLK